MSNEITPTKKQRELQELGYTYRGKLLALCINLERCVEFYLAYYFTSDGVLAMEMVELIISRLTFDAKIGCLETMLKKKDAENYKKKFSKLLSELRIIKDERNKFAHQTHNILVGDFIVLEAWKKEPFTEYSKNDFEVLFKRIEKCVGVVWDLLGNEWGLDELGSPYKL
jgi:hypothetical protein